MSHYTTLVLIGGVPSNIEESAAEQLKPFDENTEVPEYETDCHCVKQGTTATCGFYTEKYHPGGHKPGERFEDNSGCGGTGRIVTTYNPKSKWDWWEVGGRWQGDLNGKNSCAVQELNGYVPFAILTPDGHWHERGKMGWWACVSEEKPDWDKQAKAILAQYPNCIAILCDLHI